MVKEKCYKFILLSIVVVWLTSCSPSTPQQRLLAYRNSNIAENDQRVQAIVALMEQCPVYNLLEKNDEVGKAKIMETLRKISEYNLSEIRKAIEVLDEKSHLAKSKAAGINCIRLLHRYLFNVSESTPYDEPYARDGSPYDEKTNLTNWLAPFTYNSKGELQLTGQLEALNGPRFLPLKQFDWFYLTFGPRKFVHDK